MRVYRHRRLPHRCSRCEARHTFSRRWDKFERPKKCWSCGYTRFYVDKWMIRRGREQKCNCGGYHFPHRKNGGFCYESPQAEARWAQRHDEAARV